MKDTNKALSLAGILLAAWTGLADAQNPYPPYSPTTKELRSQAKNSPTDRLNQLEQRVTALESFLAETYQTVNPAPAVQQEQPPVTYEVAGSSLPVHGQQDPNLGRYHTIREGETLNAIAQTHGIALDELVSTNNLDPYGPIYVGDQIWIPGGASAPQEQVAPSPGTGAQGTPWNQPYQVRPGDTLHSIARWAGVSEDEIAYQNRLADVNQIYVGQTLVLPSGTVGSGQSHMPTQASAQVVQKPQEETYHYYDVVAGDTLTSIAATFFTSEAELGRLNQLAGNHLQVGQRLVVPTRRYFERMRQQNG